MWARSYCLFTNNGNCVSNARQIPDFRSFIICAHQARVENTQILLNEDLRVFLSFPLLLPVLIMYLPIDYHAAFIRLNGNRSVLSLTITI